MKTILSLQDGSAGSVEFHIFNQSPLPPVQRVSYFTPLGSDRVVIQSTVKDSIETTAEGIYYCNSITEEFAFAETVSKLVSPKDASFQYENNVVIKCFIVGADPVNSSTGIFVWNNTSFTRKSVWQIRFIIDGTGGAQEAE